MKKILLTTLTIVGSALIIQSCKKDNLTQNPSTLSASERTVKIGDLTTIMPEGYDPEILNYSETDLDHILHGLKLEKDSTVLDIYYLDSITQPIIANYPILSTSEENSEEVLSTVSDDFGGVSEEVIMENIEEINDYYSVLVRTDLLEKLLKIEKGAGPYSYQPKPTIFGGLNLKEILILIGHPLWIGECEDAAYDAKLMTTQMTYQNDPTDNRADGFRHIMWNYLLCKYIGYDNENVSETVEFVRRITNAHEYSSSNSISSAMDYHNNYIGRYLFSSQAYYHKNCTFCPTQLLCPDHYVVAEYVRGTLMTAGIKATTVATINLVPQLTLVFIAE